MEFDPLSILIKNSPERSSYVFGYEQGTKDEKKKKEDAMNLLEKKLNYRIEEVIEKKIPKIGYFHSQRFTEFAESLAQKWYLAGLMDSKKLLTRLKEDK